jgi:hypothetical protein
VLGPDAGKLEGEVPSQKLELGSEGTSTVMIGRIACELVISMVSRPALPLDEENVIPVGDKTWFSEREVPDA